MAAVNCSDSWVENNDLERCYLWSWAFKVTDAAWILKLGATVCVVWCGTGHEELQECLQPKDTVLLCFSGKTMPTFLLSRWKTKCVKVPVGFQGPIARNNTKKYLPIVRNNTKEYLPIARNNTKEYLHASNDGNIQRR